MTSGTDDIDVVAGQDDETDEPEEDVEDAGDGVGGKVVVRKRRKSHSRHSLPAGQGRFLAQEKARKALELRKGGASYSSIAQAVGYKNESGARRAVLRAYGQVIHEPVEELRGLQVERLNHMLLTLWPKVQSGDERAIMTALSVMDRIDRISGTEAAQKVDVSVQHEQAVLVIDGDKDAYVSAMRKLAGIEADGSNGGRRQKSSQVTDVGEVILDAVVLDEAGGPEDGGYDTGGVTTKVYKFGVDPLVTSQNGKTTDT